MTAEAEAADAFDLEAGVLAARNFERRSWVVLAEKLDEFHSAKAWQHLGYEKFSDWLGIPEVGIAPRHALRLIQCWRWAGANDVPVERLYGIDLFKIALVIAAVNRHEVDASTALSDAETLSRSDLTEKYTGAVHRASPEPVHMVTCQVCGLRREGINDSTGVVAA